MMVYFKTTLYFSGREGNFDFSGNFEKPPGGEIINVPEG